MWYSPQHGGGWVLANLDVYDSSCRAITNAAKCSVISVAYRQAPEDKFPAAPNDAIAAYRWVLDNAASINVDPARAEFDPLRDEGEAYAKRLQDAGVNATLTRYPGVTHEFFSMAGVLDKAKQAVTEAATALQKAFGISAVGGSK